MMFNFGFQKKLLSLTIMIVVTFSSISSKETSSATHSSPNVNNYLIVMDKADFNFDESNINYAYMQLKESPNKNKARSIAAKWASLFKTGMEYKPFHVKNAGENIADWKNYLVLLMGKNESYLLKKVCFSSDNSNIGIVIDQNKSCKEKVKK